MRLQNGETRAAEFSIVNDTIGTATGQSGFIGVIEQPGIQPAFFNQHIAQWYTQI
jgi:hypothetical protein